MRRPWLARRAIPPRAVKVARITRDLGVVGGMVEEGIVVREREREREGRKEEERENGTRTQGERERGYGRREGGVSGGLKGRGSFYKPHSWPLRNGGRERETHSGSRRLDVHALLERMGGCDLHTARPLRTNDQCRYICVSMCLTVDMSPSSLFPLSPLSPSPPSPAYPRTSPHTHHSSPNPHGPREWWCGVVGGKEGRERGRGAGTRHRQRPRRDSREVSNAGREPGQDRTE